MPAVVALLLACGEDPNHALVEGASFGRDADTIASILGGMVGALHGADALRPDWIAHCERANTDFFAEVHGDPRNNFRAMATQLVDTLAAQRHTVQHRLRTLDTLLDPVA